MSGPRPADSPRGMRERVTRLWSVARAKTGWARRRARLGVAVGAPAAAALALGMVMPRGPVSTADALVSLLACLAVGLVSGFALRSRWALLAAPAVFAVVFEMVRLGEAGPTVDGVHLGSVYGIIAFISGRGVHAILALLPMVLGAVVGAGITRHADRTGSARHADDAAASQPRRIGLVARRAVAGATALALIALAVFIAMPAGTPEIRDANGAVVPGSIAELATVDVGGSEQAVMIRGRSTDDPVLLFLAGGPGGSEIGSMRNLSEGLEQDFVVATWDQPGTGKSVGAFDSGMTIESTVADTIAVTEYLRERFDEEKVYLVGNSWGTILGVLAVQDSPELFHAFVGAGQMVSTVETDRLFYEDTLAWAERDGNTDLVETLRANGPPPYEDTLKYEAALSHEHDWSVYPGQDAIMEKGEMPGNIMVGEYSLMEKLRLMGGMLDTFCLLYPQLDGIDLRRDAASLAVPVYLVQGAYEARGRAVPAAEWFEMLRAPSKQMIVFEKSGHKTLFEEADRFRQVMTETVLPATYPGRGDEAHAFSD
ncbi:MAG: alpha/beta fold hydrolase [Thermoleophilia bacterium]|nr:alpha/beta fold hydrolase [Thermoleophilia bacterium]